MKRKIGKEYLEQVKLLTKILPYVAKEGCFALKGGTAINFFHYDLPRLSVDIDLTYTHFNDRKIAYEEINKALERIKENLNKAGFSTKYKNPGRLEKKLLCTQNGITIKIEPNYNMRGCYTEPIQMDVSKSVNQIFGFASMRVLSFEEIFGGKICAALDRQHPRDLFDCKYLLDNEGITSKIKKGFLIALLSQTTRPIHEMLKPKLQDNSLAFENKFKGMTEHNFTYEKHTETFHKLVDEIHKTLTPKDRKFLLSFVKLEHNWKHLDIKNIHKFPAIKWKILNLQKLKETDLKQFNKNYELLKSILN